MLYGREGMSRLLESGNFVLMNFIEGKEKEKAIVVAGRAKLT